MNELSFRKLRADEIESRVQKIGKTQQGFYTMILLYKDARCDMNVLDETVGIMNWQRHHTRDNANCIVSIYDETKEQWVSKEDTGAESFSQKEKGLASDSFKRACFNWGIGRELYTAPTIFINLSEDEVFKNKKGQYQLNRLRFHVSKIQYNKTGQIDFLEIRDNKNKIRFSYGVEEIEENKITEVQMAEIRSLYDKRIPNMLKHYKLEKLEDMTEERAKQLIALEKKAQAEKRSLDDL